MPRYRITIDVDVVDGEIVAIAPSEPAPLPAAPDVAGGSVSAGPDPRLDAVMGALALADAGLEESTAGGLRGDAARALSLLDAGERRELSGAEEEDLLALAAHLQETAGDDAFGDALLALADLEDAGPPAPGAAESASAEEGLFDRISPAIKGAIDGARPSALLRWAQAAGMAHPEDLLPGTLPALQEGVDPDSDWGYPEDDAEAVREVLRREAENDQLPGRGPPAAGSWANYLGVQGFEDAQRVHTYDVIKPATIPALVRELSGLRSGQRARVVGGSHSSSDVAQPHEVLITLDDLDDISALGLPGGPTADPPLLKPGALPAPWRAVRAPAGARIRRLNRDLAKLGLAFDQLGAFDGQSLIGATATGTHGSGAAQGPICDYVLSLEVAAIVADPDRPDGRRVALYRIEPDGGITDPRAFARAAQQRGGGLDWSLIQDDDLFYAAVVSMGCMGVIFAATIAARPAFALDESRSLGWLEGRDQHDGVPWSGLRSELDGAWLAARRRRFPPLDRPQLELLFNPYRPNQRNKGIRCVVTRRTVRPAGRSTGQSRPVARALRAGKTRGPSGMARAVGALARNRALARTVLNTALRNTSGGGGDDWLPSDSHEVLLLGAGRFVTASSCEVMIRVDDTLRAIRALTELADELAQRDPPILHTSPVGVRFVRSTRAFLAPQYSDTDEIWASIEVPMLLHSRGWRRLVRRSEALLCEEFDGRAHWGQKNRTTAAQAAERWGAEPLRRWLAAWQFLDPLGVFDNPFVERVGLRARLQSDPVPPWRRSRGAIT